MDPFTVIVMLAIHLVSTGGLLFLVWRLMPAAPGLARWWVASSLFGLAYLARLFGGLDSTDPRGLAGDAVMMLAVLLFNDGVREFVGKPLVRRRTTLSLWLALVAIETAAALLRGPSARHGVLNLAIGLLYAGVTTTLALAVRTQPLPLRAPLRLLGALLGGLAALTLLRAHSIASDGIAVAFHGRMAQVFYVYASLAAVVVGLTLLWMLFLRLNGQLAELATRDALTGVLNRNGLDQAVKQHFARRDAPALTLLLLDIDHFKQINDCFGHATGDVVLKTVATTLASHLRSGDFVARTGGEEFLVGCVGGEQALAIALAERLNRSIDRLRLRSADGTRSVACTVSVGVSARCASLSDWQRCALQADEALYLAKDAGRNAVRPFVDAQIA